MNVAYLILAHTDPPQLRRLVNALNGEHASFFIHVDKKVDIKQFAAEIGQGGNVRFAGRRTKVHPGGFSMVEATLILMREASVVGIPFDYYVLLSGLDYPIKSNRSILHFFIRNRGREFIRYINLLEEPFLGHKATRMRFRDHVVFDRASGALRRTARLIGIGRLSFERRFLEGFVPYYGSQWWALTQECVKYILRFVDAHSEFVRFYRISDVPDEMFFHTIIMNSAFAKMTNQRVEHARWVGRSQPVKEAGDAIKYIDWSLDRERPAILDERDFEALEKSAYLFARKFTTGRSLRLIEQIDMRLLESQPAGPIS